VPSAGKRRRAAGAPPPPPPPSELLTIDEVAVFLRTTPKAIRMRIDRGQLPGVVRVGRSVLVRRADLRKHLGLSSTKPAGDVG
jgi:excisionase family DNA binding protein